MTSRTARLPRALKDKLVEHRRYLHQHAELSFREEHTSRWIGERLKELGVEVREKVGGNGLVGRIKGKHPGPKVAFRADFDALPIEEENDVPYKSTNAGVMHACGHDGHAAMLLGLAETLRGELDLVRGEVVFLFQHAEEQLPGGALSMIEDGCLEGVQAIFGVHLTTTLPTGEIGVRDGPAMAAADYFRVEITGRGGHGGSPHQTIDALVIAAKAVMDLQLVVSRCVDPLEPAVVSVGRFEAGSAFNVIAGRAGLEGTARTASEDVRALVERKLEQTIRGVCEETGANYDFEYQRGYPPLINHPRETDIVRRAVEDLDGCSLVARKPVMAGEDFAYYLQRTPGCFFFIGAANEQKGISYPNHHPRFDIDEDALAVGVEAMLATYLEYTARNAETQA